MSRPQFEVADIIRSAGADFIARNRHWLPGPTSRSCWPSRAVAPPLSNWPVNAQSLVTQKQRTGESPFA
jgi:hypothetical protein